MTTDPEAGRGRCPACQGNEVYHRKTWANGGYGPRLLQGLGRLFKPAKIDVYLCADCGHLVFSADAEARENVKQTVGWRKLR